MDRPSPSPTPLTARDPELDATRGLALVGVFLVNLPVMVLGPIRAAVPDSVLPSWGNLPWFLLHALVEGKAVAALGMLVGTGMLARSVRLGSAWVGVELRRIVVLAVFGAVHHAVWAGDVLWQWALASLLLLPVLRRGDAAVAAGMAVGLAAGFLGYGLGPQVAWVALGVLLVRRPRLRRAVPWLALLGLGYELRANGWVLPLHLRGLHLDPGLRTGLHALASTALGAAWPRLLRPPAGVVRDTLAALGRMTLTMYLVQTAVGLVVPGGPMGRLMLVALVTVGVQAAAARAWRRRGPAEAVLRWGMYR